MGYRSEVYIKIDKKQTFAFQKILDEHKVDWYNNIRQDSDEYLKVYFSEVKWYDGYPEVDAINKFINSTDNCGAIAVGEDSAVVEYGDTWEVDMYVTVSVGGF